MFDLIIIGAGPAGLACALEAKKKNLSYLVLDKGSVVESIYRFPADMEFFSTPDLLQIGDAMFITESFRPTRIQALHYYLSVVKNYQLKVEQDHLVSSITKHEDTFEVLATHQQHEKLLKSKKVIVATGYFDNPNLLGIEGEELPKVSHYYTEAHPCYNQDVLIIGGKNSAVESALSFSHIGARVTMVHRGSALSDSVKYWIRPEIEKRLKEGKIEVHFNSEVTKINPDSVVIKTGNSETTVANDKVFALTGYHPDIDFLKKCGVQFDPATMVPEHNPKNFETNIEGLHLAGSIAAGINCNKIFIENSREHGKMILS